MPARTGTARSFPENVPPGTVFSFAGSTAPTGYLLCDGTVYDIADYPDLFNAISNFWGGDGVTTFAVPNAAGRVSVHAGAGGGGLTTRNLGDVFGSERHTLNTLEMPSHSHTDSGHSHDGFRSFNNPGAGNNYPYYAGTGTVLTNASIAPGVTWTLPASASLSNSGGDQSHNNLQPSIVFHAIIKF